MRSPGAPHPRLTCAPTCRAIGSLSRAGAWPRLRTRRRTGAMTSWPFSPAVASPSNGPSSPPASPVHTGDPAARATAALTPPDWGAPPVIGPGETPVFWACGVTAQAAVAATAPDYAITHAPGHMFITDLRDASLALT